MAGFSNLYVEFTEIIVLVMLLIQCRIYMFYYRLTDYCSIYVFLTGFTQTGRK